MPRIKAQLGDEAHTPRSRTAGVTLAAYAIAHTNTPAAIQRFPRRVFRIDRIVFCCFPHSGHTTGSRETSPSTPVKSYQHLRQRSLGRPRNPARSHSNPRPSTSKAIANNTQ
jgi:hypothetical protein